ncbi:hypothetical protein [Methylobacterium sp. J-076]|uniref:hypothetical protein n=1 Tax=Methylobacterium sp. J-076 TaxID=2836655 RepID=UPI001FB9B7DA|nr:hypothetical protein [Methylobacterium sp. J-076]MCJ2011747.1 hypothetical protein [Methylobacterium sp. J-076]
MDVIHDDPPMRQEIARGFYPAFEDRWRTAEIVGRFAMLAFVLVCALGILGHGPFSARDLANADGSIRIRYEPVVRFGAPTIIRFDTRVPPGGDKVAVTIAKDLVDQFGLESITPRPATWEIAGGNIRLVFPVQAGESHALIRFTGSPAFRGGVDLTARLDAGETLSWSQYAVP